MKLFYKLLVMILTIFVLTGCLYPKQKIEKNSVPYEHQVDEVQTAIDNYQKDTNGLLPIKTVEMETPKYRKYMIDFNRLIPRYLPEPPVTAYENGGVFLYVITDPETNPKVKLIDLHIVEQIRELKLKIHQYRQVKKYPPFKDVVAKGVFNINYKELGYKNPPQVKSPFSGNYLPLVIDGNAEIYVDYRIDLNDALKKNPNHGFKKGEDIRDILVENSMFVPAFSLPYTIDEKNEPIFLEK